ncbi:unnamed protein product [Spirodela intermedia]|uniref:Uncharacterized protein n=1 Tax=Spirodela intermedia TaxID=51605 RepID=A0A7I8JEE0_SPIIN|nr:unnamed protein product [Spirodela intermedia]CAA6668518.1 unnamed protein product [Spirodela intermedia]
MEVGACQRASSSGPHSKRRLSSHLTSREDLEIAHVVFVQGEPSRPWTLHDDPPEHEIISSYT